MRKQILVFLPLLLIAMVAAAETQSNGTEAHKRSALVKVQAVPSNDGLNLEFVTRGDVTPNVSELESPARLVVDLPNTLALTAKNIIVENTGVKRIRIGMDGQVQPTTRLVIDLEKPCTYELSGSGNNRVLKVHTGVASAKAAKPAAETKVAVAVPEAPKQTASINPATEFAFVEPSYKVKDEAASDPKAAVEPSVRVVNAAAKFAERPAGDLLPHASAAMAPQVATNLAAEQKNQMAQPAAVGGPKYTGEPISVNLKDVDLKDFFRLIHEISGLNVVLDPNVKGSLTIVLDDVPWDQALDIVLKNNDLARQLDGNVLRIATVDTLRKEAESKRAQQEAEAMAVEKVTITRFLSYAHSKDVVPTIKQFLSQRGDVISDDRTNALIIQDIPSAIPSIDRLLTQLDRKTQEVEIEARVVAATRSFAREIGTQLGFGWGNGHSAVGGASSVGTSPLSTFGGNPQWISVGNSAPSASTPFQIPLFSNLGVTQPNSGISLLNVSNNVRIDGILTLAESRGLLKILSRPRVVTQNNISALVKQGVRVPIVTQAQLGGPPTVTYVDAFLRLTVIPQITSEGTIFLNVDVENTSPDFGHAVQGNPTLITQQATTQVLVTDGGTVVIGGVIQTQNSVSVDQVPLLGNIPYLGNLFKHRNVTTSNSELIFFITPRIIQT
ncbi:MAG TPA: type IV pilus secretin PilQ [Terriglobales bacterium]|nr:type IV pilus secretin PilQ [Terriglobales bacterium]